MAIFCKYVLFARGQVLLVITGNRFNVVIYTNYI